MPSHDCWLSAFLQRTHCLLISSLYNSLNFDLTLLNICTWNLARNPQQLHYFYYWRRFCNPLVFCHISLYLAIVLLCVVLQRELMNRIMPEINFRPFELCTQQLPVVAQWLSVLQWHLRPRSLRNLLILHSVAIWTCYLFIFPNWDRRCHSQLSWHQQEQLGG